MSPRPFSPLLYLSLSKKMLASRGGDLSGARLSGGGGERPRMGSGGAGEPLGEARALRQLRASWHISIEARLLVRQRDFEEASAHCAAALSCSRLGRVCSAARPPRSPPPPAAAKAASTASATAAASRRPRQQLPKTPRQIPRQRPPPRQLTRPPPTSEAESLTQLRRFAEAFACLPATLEFAQRGGSPHQAPGLTTTRVRARWRHWRRGGCACWRHNLRRSGLSITEEWYRGEGAAAA